MPVASALSEIIEHSHGGELFDTEEELRSAMGRLQHDTVRRREMGESGLSGVSRRWSESAVVPAYLDLVRRAGERRATPSPAGATTA